MKLVIDQYGIILYIYITIIKFMIYNQD